MRCKNKTASTFKIKKASALKDKIPSALKDQSGASLLFVLGVMMMLLAVGTSVLAAAFGNIGINIRQDNYNRAMLLSDSIHRNIKHSLEMTGNEFLSGQIAWEIYRSGGNMDDIDGIELDVAISGFSEIGEAVRSVTLFFSPPPYSANASITPFSEGVPELVDPDDPNCNCIWCPRPEIAHLSARMLVRVEVYVDRAAGVGDRRFITSEAVYVYSGGVLTGPPDGPPANISDMAFLTPSDRGSWGIESFEIIES